VTLDLRAHFSTFRNAAPERIHLAAHSHHYWPDAACEAHADGMRWAAHYADQKWDPILQGLLPHVAKQIARILVLPDPETIAFAPNTHELVCRLMSALPMGRPPRVLTSDSEFHSFERQITRLEEDGLVTVVRIATEPSESFTERFCAAAARGGHDLIFVSHVFYNSGATCGDLAPLVDAVKDPDSLIAIDGYHGFMALPLGLSQIANRAFYLAGGYKYAMAGEGACFMHCPPGYAPRPRDTGWFAGFAALGDGADKVAYGTDGSRFLGATFDTTPLHRMSAVFAWMDRIGLTVATIHGHVMALQGRFLAATRDIAPLQQARLVTPIAAPHGHFLTYETPAAAAIKSRLAAANIVTDVRGNRIRFGFGCYHTVEDIDRAVVAMKRALDL
jgi:selenocysteine lyase/cysteine desulfurase